MKMLLMREPSTALCTPGVLWIEVPNADAEFCCFTLEDIMRPAGEKVYGKTAIPAGEYRVTVSHSEKFNRYLPLLLNVPNFEGIRIHPGNSADDTEGCILVGMMRGANGNNNLVLQSKVAFERLYALIREAIERREEVHIRIENP